MKIRVPLGIITAVMMILAVMVLPVSAADVNTTANIAPPTGGSTSIVLCKWEQLPPVSEQLDDDPLQSGSQFLPPLEWKGAKAIYYFAVVYDSMGTDVKVVAWDVYHPENEWGDGSFKYQIEGEEWGEKFDAAERLRRAADAGLVTFDGDYELADVTESLLKGEATLWYGVADIHTCQPAGYYTVEAHAWDYYDREAVPLVNIFEYVPVVGYEIDFNEVNYGDVRLQGHKWVKGDTTFGTPNLPTIRNIGNTFLQVTIEQDDMQLGERLVDGNSVWNVQWDARMGNDDDNRVVYAPFEEVTLPNALKLCEIEELDFSIEVYKGSGAKTGTMTLGAVISPIPE